MQIDPEIQSMLDQLASGDPTIAMEFDPWAWAYYNKLILPDGQFTLKGRGYQLEPLQSQQQRLCARKATQGGWTLLMVLRAMHLMIKGHYSKGLLYLFPTQDDVTDFSSSRFKPLINDNKEVIGNFIRDTNRDNLKRIGNGFLYFRGARLQKPSESSQKSSSKLKSIPVDEVVFDELDEMDPAAKDLALARMADSPHKRERYLGNPTIPDYGIDRLYESESDRRIYLIKCEHCGHETCLELEFPDCLKKRRGGDAGRGGVGHYDILSQQTYRACVKCSREIFPDNGRWEARNPDRSDRMHGYWNSQLIQPRTDLDELLRSWENLELSQNVTRSTTDFYNLRLGMAYIAAENRLTVNDIYNVCSLEPMLSGFYGPCGMGVDIGNIKHCVIGYRPNESMLKVIKLVRVSTFNDIWDLIKRFNVQCVVLDALPEKTKVIELIDSLTNEGYACYYDRSQRTNPGWDSKERRVKINRTDICDATHSLIKVPGRVILPRRSDEIEQYALEMSNIAKILYEDPDTGSKEYLYKALGPDHYRHATNYFLMAIQRVGVAVAPSGGGHKDKWSDMDGPVQGSFLGM